MIRVIKSEWHQVEKRYGLIISRDDLTEIYPDYDESQIDELMNDIHNDDADYDQIIEDSNDANVYLDWEWLDEDDWWTDRKGGYDVTYSVETDYEQPVSDAERIHQLEDEIVKLKALIAKSTVEEDEEWEEWKALEELKTEFDHIVSNDDSITVYNDERLVSKFDKMDLSKEKSKKTKKTVDKSKKTK